MTDGADDDRAPDRLDKLALEIEDLRAAILAQGELIRVIADGRVALAERRICREQAPGRRLLDVIAGAIIAVMAIGALLYYLVVHPWPAWGIYIPPPHSSQIPTEEAYR
jgi:hypothetical protein